MDINADAFGSLEQQIAALNGRQAARNNPALSEQAQTTAADEFGDTTLTQGQAMHVDHLLSTEADTLARETLITLKRDGLPPNSHWNEFMTRYALSGWYADSDAIAWARLAAIAKSDWDEWLGHADSQLADAEKQQPYIPTIGVKVLGAMSAYADEAFDPNLDAPVQIFRNDYTSAPLSVLRYSKLNALRVLVEIGDVKYWIDTTDEDAKSTFVALGQYDDAFEQEAGEVVANGNQPDYEILPVITDEVAHGGYSNIEVSDPEWADRTGRDDDPKTKRGALSRDYNHVPDEDNPERTQKTFRLQSPVVGPDVRVEFVVRDYETLEDYVVVSFPASYYQSLEAIMNQLAMQDQAASHLQNQGFTPHLPAEERAKLQRKARLAEHNPERWHEDGRIFYAFAHLSQVSVNAGQILDGRDKAIIGMTGKSRTGAHHLDLVFLYVGSSFPGSGTMAKAMFELGWDSGNAELFFGLAERSQLYPTNDISVLYGENPDSARLHPELDESGIAEFTAGYSIYAEE